MVAQDGVIAPGTCGKFTINLTNESEVNAKYAYTLAATTAGIPIEFSEDKTSWKSISDFNKSDSIGMNASANRTLYWRWAFESGTTDAEKATADKTDTNLGFNSADANQKVVVTANLTLTQVD